MKEEKDKLGDLKADSITSQLEILKKAYDIVSERKDEKERKKGQRRL